jgi:hypothetical protein
MKTIRNSKKIIFASFFTVLLLVHCGVDPDITDSEITALQGGSGDGLEDRQAELNNKFPPERGNRTFISDDEINQIILKDLEGIQGSKRDIRYLTLTHLYNAEISSREITTQSYGIAKLLNSLSYASEIKMPQAIDDSQTIFRIKLSDYRWNRNTWNVIARRNIYFRNRGTQAERQIANLTGTRSYAFKADWFASEASQGNLYAFIMNLPRNVRTLEFRLMGRSADDNIRRRNVARLGVYYSGVSAQNRMIERHETKFGAYWKSYDFEESKGRARRNLFEFPLDSRNFRNGFEFAGGEMIFNLPNGLQAYMLTDVNGNRINKGPQNVVNDGKRPDHAVSNGISCMSCHNKGMQTARDQLRTHVEKNSFAFDRFTVQAVRQLYPGNDKMAALYNSDKDRFKAAMDKIGYSVNAPEPTLVLVSRYETDLSLEQAAAELGLTKTEFENGIGRSQFLSRRLGQVLLKGRVKREIFEDNFFNLVRNLRVGQSQRYETAVSESSTTEEENGDLTTVLPQAIEEEATPPPALIEDPDA